MSERNARTPRLDQVRVRLFPRSGQLTFSSFAECHVFDIVLPDHDDDEQDAARARQVPAHERDTKLLMPRRPRRSLAHDLWIPTRVAAFVWYSSDELAFEQDRMGSIHLR